MLKVWIVGGTLAVIVGWRASVSVGDAPKIESDPPNIVILLADDLGWNDVGYHGSDAKTPHIDAFVKEGIELDRFYSAPYCRPTRAGLMSGRYPHRFELPYQANFRKNNVLPAATTTVPEVLAQAGYRARAHLGKWHLGRGRARHPLKQGFTRFYGCLGGMIHYFDHKSIGLRQRSGDQPRVLDWHDDWESLEEDGYSTDLIGTEAVKWIRRQRGDLPFFLYVAFNAPHLPLHAKPALAEEAGVESAKDPLFVSRDTETNRRLLRAMVASLDENVGRILDTLDQHGMHENTLVLFFSDNGGTTKFGISDNSPLRGEKNTMWEGGVRVPAAIRWPAAWPAGQKITQPLAYIDVLPTLAAVAQAETLSENLDGRDFSDLLKGGAWEERRKIYLGPDTVVTQRWKWSGDQLFAIDADPGETTNVIDQHPDVAARLRCWAAKQQ